MSSNSPNIEKTLLIDGAGCASCVGKIEGALLEVTGVQKASMNFAQRTVLVTGDVVDHDLIRAVESVGYQASFVDENDQDLLDEKEKSEAVYYSRLMREMTTRYMTPDDDENPPLITYYREG